MDQSLDDVIAERQRGSNNRARNNGRRDRRRNDAPRDGIRKSSSRDESRNLDRDWVHDKYEDDEDTRRPARGSRFPRNDRGPAEADIAPQGAKLRIDNVHYDLTDADLEGLFERIGPIRSVSIRYDRAGRSDGTAFVTYESISDARRAIREFDGANANGQPISLKLMPTSSTGGAQSSRARNPFDTAEKPGRSLFDRVSAPTSSRNRSSRSPDRFRQSDVSRPPPENIDRYVPGRQSRSPLPRRGGGGGGGGGGRRPGARREDSGRREGGGGGGGGGRRARDGRPKKTQEELDAEMEDYWGNKGEAEQTTNGAGVVPTTNGAAALQTSAAANDDDIDMIE